MTKFAKSVMVIPARGGSKRVVRKNSRLLAGKPLICWSIEAALATGLDAKIIITSDDDEILAIAKGYESQGVITHKRSEELASDTASTTHVIIDVVQALHESGYEAEIIVILQPTSPLRKAEDILAALNVFTKSENKDTVVSVSEMEHPSAWIGFITQDSYFSGIESLNKRSQDYKKEYRLNGAVYVVDAGRLMSTGSLFTERLLASVMPRSRSFDIDEELDFRICEFMANYG